MLLLDFTLCAFVRFIYVVCVVIFLHIVVVEARAIVQIPVVVNVIVCVCVCAVRSPWHRARRTDVCTHKYESASLALSTNMPLFSEIRIAAIMVHITGISLNPFRLYC